MTARSTPPVSSRASLLARSKTRSYLKNFGLDLLQLLQCLDQVCFRSVVASRVTQDLRHGEGLGLYSLSWMSFRERNFNPLLQLV